MAKKTTKLNLAQSRAFDFLCRALAACERENVKLFYSQYHQAICGVNGNHVSALAGNDAWNMDVEIRFDVSAHYPCEEISPIHDPDIYAKFRSKKG